jgi:hypothetical protein
LRAATPTAGEHRDARRRAATHVTLQRAPSFRPSCLCACFVYLWQVGCHLFDCTAAGQERKSASDSRASRRQHTQNQTNQQSSHAHIRSRVWHAMLTPISATTTQINSDSTRHQQRAVVSNGRLTMLKERRTSVDKHEKCARARRCTQINTDHGRNKCRQHTKRRCKTTSDLKTRHIRDVVALARRHDTPTRSTYVLYH